MRVRCAATLRGVRGKGHDVNQSRIALSLRHGDLPVHPTAEALATEPPITWCLRTSRATTPAASAWCPPTFPVHHGHQVGESSRNRDAGDVRAPHLVRMSRMQFVEAAHQRVLDAAREARMGEEAIRPRSETGTARPTCCDYWRTTPSTDGPPPSTDGPPPSTDGRRPRRLRGRVRRGTTPSCSRSWDCGTRPGPVPARR